MSFLPKPQKRKKNVLFYNNLFQYNGFLFLSVLWSIKPCIYTDTQIVPDLANCAPSVPYLVPCPVHIFHRTGCSEYIAYFSSWGPKVNHFSEELILFSRKMAFRDESGVVLCSAWLQPNHFGLLWVTRTGKHSSAHMPFSGRPYTHEHPTRLPSRPSLVRSNAFNFTLPNGSLQ